MIRSMEEEFKMIVGVRLVDRSQKIEANVSQYLCSNFLCNFHCSFSSFAQNSIIRMTSLPLELSFHFQVSIMNFLQ